MVRRQSKPKRAATAIHGTRYEIFTRSDGQWSFHLLSRNGKIMFQSEGYPNASHCRRAIRSIARALAQPVPVVTLKDGAAL